ncbi:hypothetical protein TWF718_007195 [Orbilia javanica]|uniref:Yippee domain-containing protein n=1 Tax=Orbilia javanica TaxID=47235 RepID=A0AAN8MT69_9PEZI
MSGSLNFPRFLLPAFPRWESAILKRHRPVEDVTSSEPEQMGAPIGRRQSRRLSGIQTAGVSDVSEDDELQGGIPVRQGRNLSHDSGCVISDEDDEEEEEEEVEGESEDEEDGEYEDENDRAYTYALSKGRYPASTDSLEIYLDTESGYGGSSDELAIPNLNAASSSSSSSSSPSSSSSSSPSSSPPFHHNQQTIPTTSTSTKKKFAFWPSKPRHQPLPSPPKPTLSTTTTYLNCSTCRTNLCFSSSVISKGFTGRHGRAYLVSSLIPSNIIHGKPTSRALQTGAHTVSDISCKICGCNLGWKYIHAEERGQRYKIGKYILETGRVGKVNYWDGEVDDQLDEDGRRKGEKRSLKGSGDRRMGWEPGWEDLGDGDDDDVEVDLADEEELEAMFAGSWNKDKALRRRERRRLAEEARRKVDSNV